MRLVLALRRMSSADMTVTPTGRSLLGIREAGRRHDDGRLLGLGERKREEQQSGDMENGDTEKHGKPPWRHPRRLVG